MADAVAAIGMSDRMAEAVAIDVGDSGKALPSIAAALVGKAYLVGCLVAIGVAWYLIGKLEAWREALADHRAEKVCGREPLLLAEALIEAREPDAAISAARRPHVRSSRN